MRILMVSRGVVPIGASCGGAELVCYQLAKTLQRVGHEVTLVSDIDEGERDHADGVEIVPIGGRLVGLAARLPHTFPTWLVRHLVGNIASARRVRALLRGGRRFDVIHAHGNLSAALTARYSTTPVVYTEHDATPWLCRYRGVHERVVRKALYRLLNGAAYRRVDRVATIFDSLRDELVERFHVQPERVRTIMNGTDFDVFNPDTAPSPQSGRIPFERYCLFVGQLTARKAPDLLLEALVEAPGRNCVFVGDGPLRPRLEAQAASLGLGDRVVLLGSVAPRDLPGLYAGADLLVLPSVSDGPALVVIEAMACGTPALTTRIGGFPDLVKDGETGFMVKAGDVGQLAVALRFLTDDPARLEEMGAEAQRRVRKRFLWPNVAREYLDLYYSLIPGVRDFLPGGTGAPSRNAAEETFAGAPR